MLPFKKLIILLVVGLCASITRATPLGKGGNNGSHQTKSANQAPIAIDDIAQTGDTTLIEVDLISGPGDDYDPDGDSLFISIISGPFYGYATLLGPDSISYISKLGFCGYDYIIYRVCDNGQPSLCDTATLYIGVTPKDDDGDKLPNYYEGFALDTDNDGILDYLDLDTDNDGIPDSLEALGSLFDICDITIADSDKDGIPDHKDLDSDNDGVADIVEGGNPDINSDGIVDDFTDLNQDGISDINSISNPVSTDTDGVPNYKDKDSDNDGITDLKECGGIDEQSKGTIVNTFVDNDHNGWDDHQAVTSLPDFDNDGVPDYIDLDSDNDGITDIVEANFKDINGDAVIDLFSDINKDGMDDTTRTGVPIDFDADGKPDYVDLDSDDDRLEDIIEAGSNGKDIDYDGMIDMFTDANKDGMDDSRMVFFPLDTDQDSAYDFRDYDSDNDKIGDQYEIDEDDNGILDDCNKDGIPDFREAENCIVEVPEAFSPNNDHVNDKLIIHGLYRYPKHTLKIFNRWGNVVYEAAPYENDWAGNNSLDSENTVPDGVYFYTLDLGDGQYKNGSIYIKK